METRTTVEHWCTTCCTRRSDHHVCPGELAATSPEQHGWRVNVDTPHGMEAYGVLIARSNDQWRARILTFPNVLWIAPGTRATMKFVGGSPQDAEGAAVDFIKSHCAERRFTMRDGPVLADPGDVDPEQNSTTTARGRDKAPRKIRRLPVLFGVGRPHEPGVTEDVSESGLSIITEHPEETGTSLKLWLTLAGASHELAGEVVWKRKRPQLGRVPGMGILLQAPPPAYRAYVRGLS